MPSQVLDGASPNEVVKKQTCQTGKHNASKNGRSCTICFHKGRMTNKVFTTYVEANKIKSAQNKRNDLAREEAIHKFKIVTSVSNTDQNGNLVSYKSKVEDFKKEGLVAEKFRMNNQNFEVLTDGTKIIHQMATEEELIAFEQKQPLPQFSILY